MYVPLIPGNRSPAEDLFEMGKSLAHQKRCGCDQCKQQLASIKDTYKDRIIELAERWHALERSAPGKVLRGLWEEWSEAKCAEACGLTWSLACNT